MVAAHCRPSGRTAADAHIDTVKCPVDVRHSAEAVGPGAPPCIVPPTPAYLGTPSRARLEILRCAA